MKSRVAAAALVVAASAAGLGVSGGVAEASPVLASGTAGYLAGDDCCRKGDRDDDDGDHRNHRDPRRDQALVPGLLSGVNGLLNGVGHAVNSLLRGVV